MSAPYDRHLKCLGTQQATRSSRLRTRHSPQAGLEFLRWSLVAISVRTALATRPIREPVAAHCIVESRSAACDEAVEIAAGHPEPRPGQSRPSRSWATDRPHVASRAWIDASASCSRRLLPGLVVGRMFVPSFLSARRRVDTPADAFSDVDVALFVEDPERYLRDAAWVRSFGEPLLTFFEPTAVGGFEQRRVLFDDGLEVDFSILATGIANAPPPDAEGACAGVFRHLRRHRPAYPGAPRGDAATSSDPGGARPARRRVAFRTRRAGRSPQILRRLDALLAHDLA
jgi:hypothetical protein